MIRRLTKAERALLDDMRYAAALHPHPYRDGWLRALRAVAYLLMGTAGLLLMVSPIIRAEMGFVGWLMALFLLLGGALSAGGSATDRWVGEFTGLPLLASSFMVFAVISTIDSLEAAPLIAVANLSLLLAVGLGLLARWREVKAVQRMSTHLAKKGRRRE